MDTNLNLTAFILLPIDGLLIARFYVYLVRNKFETPELEVFIVLQEIKIQCERETAITNRNLNKYRNKWTTLFISD